MTNLRLAWIALGSVALAAAAVTVTGTEAAPPSPADRARSGPNRITDPLQAGQAAPDFELSTLDRSETFRLSSNFGVKPTVLVFGSYT